MNNQFAGNIGRSGVIGILLLAGVIAVIGVMWWRSTSLDGISDTPKITADCTLQAGRKEFIRKKVEEGYWQEIEGASIILRINVLPKFIDKTTLEDKRRMISTVSAYDFCRGGDGVLTVVDAMTGNELGHFNEHGLQWDQ